MELLMAALEPFLLISGDSEETMATIDEQAADIGPMCRFLPDERA